MTLEDRKRFDRILAETPTDVIEALGMLVREAWVEFVKETQPNPKPSHIAAWKDISDWDRAVDKHIAWRVATPFLIRIEELLNRIEELEAKK